MGSSSLVFRNEVACWLALRRRVLHMVTPLVLFGHVT